ncbi:hypothetical protein [Pseudomonas sp. KU43P]|uniref:hypothetical protein n=1 Tax=Pseudomonas sp. KU43P TaxID=2487887 RepID=UPI0012A90AB4|nr:hypothetical protein [Pseudomonas sp. KU43P]BBH45654.1 hypothetical protein KU43P_21310 [Pseudomonas sp. KU43P]
MIRWALLVLICLAGWVNAADPEVRVQARLVPDTAIMTGATVSLEVDLLVDTWFTDAPQLPTLQLAGAVVTPPGGEAQHLNQRIDGKAFFGLRYRYQITPTEAQRFSIPALAFQVQPGPASTEMTVHSQPLTFEAKGPANTKGELRLVAQQVELTQAIEPSHTPLRAGDSITRRLHLKAPGAQAMLIPPPRFAEVEGLKRYVQTPRVTALSDGRGGTLGGQREDSVSYVATAAGHYRLPAIEVKWWDAATGESHTATVPAVEVVAEAGTYQAPFSLKEDLRALGQGARVSIASHWLWLLTLLLVVIALAWAGREWGRAGWQRLRRWRARRHQAWLDSPAYALRQARQQCANQPARLDGLYLWVRRSTGRRMLSSSEHPSAGHSQDDLLPFFQAAYGAQAKQGPGPDARKHLLQRLRQGAAAGQATAQDKHGLKHLNP